MYEGSMIAILWAWVCVFVCVYVRLCECLCSWGDHDKCGGGGIGQSQHQGHCLAVHGAWEKEEHKRNREWIPRSYLTLGNY
jgi:hypothetical protein